jgi:2-polyprenyl-3-methyl-5-hydroxy-6-metoxy-1,4-benzoquinol methylase
LLDVGCAAGYFLEAARARGWETLGLELSPYTSAQAKAAGLDVYEASILDPPDLPPVDVVTLWDTIEHLSEPVLALKNARRLLKPGGVIAISTGDRRSAVARLLGARWRLMSDPTHKFFFDEATLSRLLANADLRRISSSHVGKWVGLGMVLHQLDVPGATQLRRAFSRIGWNPAVYVNLRDVITIVAEVAS